MVLGSSGQIGTALCKKLKENKDNTVVKWDIKAKPTMHDLTLGALGHTLYMAMNEVDFVYFLAEDDSNDLMLYLDANLRIMINVFQALEATQKPFVYTSVEAGTIDGFEHAIDCIQDLVKSVGTQYTVRLGGEVYTFDSHEKIKDEVEKSKVIDELVQFIVEGVS